jgi:hypothetical protein
MTTRFITAATLTLAVFAAGVGLAEAGQHHQGGGGSAAVGRAVPRGGGGGGGYPGGGGGHPGGGYPGGGYPGGGHYGGYYYRPYYGYYGYYGYPYGYYPYGFGLSIGFGYPYGYAGGYWGYPYGGYAYGYPGYAASTYGGVRITDAPKDASVYADGYYVGTVEDFDGSLQQLNLEPGPHHVEVMRQGAPSSAVDVNIRPGQTITFRAN